jgi:hypothetical protein
MGAILAALAKAWAIFQEVAPIAQVAVMAVEASTPAGTSGADKLKMATQAIHDTINAASAGADAYTNTKAAIASGDHTLVATTLVQTIETVLSIFKQTGVFSKAGVVQSASPLLPDIHRDPMSS